MALTIAAPLVSMNPGCCFGLVIGPMFRVGFDRSPCSLPPTCAHPMAYDSLFRSYLPLDLAESLPTSCFGVGVVMCSGRGRKYSA
ncbi:hypothetical protein D3C81_2212750 [compost metagenome]